MENKKIFLLAICLILLVGCQIGGNPEKTTVIEEPTALVFDVTSSIDKGTVTPNSITSVASITPEITQSVPSIQPSLTFTPEVEQTVVILQCDSNTDSNIDAAAGILLFKDKTQTSVIMLDLISGEIWKLPEDTLHQVGSEYLSPNREHLVFDQSTFEHDTTDYSGTPWVHLTDELVIYSASSDTFFELNKQDKWQYLLGWLDNENLIVSKGSPFLVIFNPFSNEWFEFSIDAPDRYWDNNDRVKVVLNPSGNLFVYLHDSESKFVVWDWEQWQPVSEIPLSGIYWYENAEYAEAYAPIWLQNGEKFILVAGQSGGANANDEIFMVGIDGSSRAITKFRDFSERISISPISLSPDGSKVAFWYSKDPSEMDSSILTIVDIDSGDITELCSTSLLNEATAPIWSPDNQYLLFSLENQDAFIISVGTKESYFVTDEMTPIGWLKK